MKNQVLFFLLLLPFLSQAQFNVWYPGQAMTDSSHNNRNAALYGTGPENILFWDKELDGSTTELCYKLMYGSANEERVALHKPGVKYTHPEIMEFSNQPLFPLCAVIYQSDEGTDTDLEYILYYPDGTFSQPTLLSSLPGDDISQKTNYSQGLVAWENNGKIWVSSYQWDTKTFTSPFAIDSAGAYNPAFTSNSLTYMKPDVGSTRLISKNIYYYLGNWVINSTSEKVIAGECSSLSTGGIMMGSYLSMQTNSGSNHSGLAISTESLPETEYRNSALYNLSQPAICSYMIGVKSLGFYILAYVSDSLGQNEIFGETPFWTNLGTNISNWPGNDVNPRIFETFPDFYFIRVNLFWESEREGFSTIYYSHYDYIFGGLNEKPAAETMIVRPSPFREETSILIRAAENTQIQIFDIQGRAIKTLFTQKDSDGWSKAIWKGTDNYGNKVASGCYGITVAAGSKSQSKIIIKE